MLTDNVEESFRPKNFDRLPSKGPLPLSKDHYLVHCRLKPQIFKIILLLQSKVVHDSARYANVYIELESSKGLLSRFRGRFFCRYRQEWCRHGDNRKAGH
jgi:hypothetical protein